MNPKKILVVTALFFSVFFALPITSSAFVTTDEVNTNSSGYTILSAPLQYNAWFFTEQQYGGVSCGVSATSTLQLATTTVAFKNTEGVPLKINIQMVDCPYGLHAMDSGWIDVPAYFDGLLDIPITGIMPANINFALYFSVLDVALTHDTCHGGSTAYCDFQLYGANPRVGMEYTLSDHEGNPIPSPEQPYIQFNRTDTTACIHDCNSNVLFFPGTMGSRLFEDDGGCGFLERERWVSTFDCDHERLALDTNGKSINSLYTKEGEDGTLASYGANIYQSFMDDLKKWKNTDHIIADYTLMPYDWRLSLEDILNNGATSTDGTLSYTQTGNFTDSYIYTKLKELVATSRTGKVTLIAHSNGGLVVKALLQKLKDNNDPLADKIDKVIFVAVPQIGTPDAVGALLYGTEVGPAGLVMSSERVRDLLHNMPLSYNFIPSETFMNSTTTPLIEFTGPAIPPALTLRYGASINTYSELIDYLLGGDGRSAPAFDDLHTAAIANGTLLPQADILHQRLDQWTPSASTTLYEIAGWGLYTPAGLQYETNKECIPSMYQPAPTDGTPQPLACSGYKDTLKVNDKLTINGDATVMEESAHAMALSSTTQKYWVDLDAHNDQATNRKHKDIFEVNTLRPFIKSIIQGNMILQPFITTDPTSLVSTDDYIKYSLHSPLTLNIYDTLGNHTGISTTTGQIEEGIKGSTYFTLGDTKTIILPASIAHTVKLDAYASGSFTLDLTELQGDTIIASTTFMGIPTATTTQATLTWNPTEGISTSTTLNIDHNGDQVTDTTLTAKPGDIVLLPASSKLPLTVTTENKTITLGSSLPTLTATLSRFVDGDTASTTVTGTPNCTTTATATSTVGTYPIICSVGTLASEKYDFTTFATGTLTILYKWSGFAQPINDTIYNPSQTLSVFKGGSTIPVKFQLKNASDTPLQASSAPQWLAPQQLNALTATTTELLYTDPASTGTTYAWDTTANQYHYNWKTKDVLPGYWYRICAKLEDGTTQSVVVGIR